MSMKLGAYTDIIKNEKNFRYMILANMISRFGDSVDAIAYSWMVYQLTGSAAWLSVILGVNMVPTVLFQPLGGALTEYFRKKRVIVICDIARGAVVFFHRCVYAAGSVRAVASACFDIYKFLHRSAADSKWACNPAQNPQEGAL